VGAVLVEDVVKINKEGAEGLDLLGCLFRVYGKNAEEFEEVEEQGFCEAFELEGTIEVF
jgi:hypothetical protein